MHGEVISRWPRDWRKSLGALAKYFHFQPSELWEFELVDVDFWAGEMKTQIDAQRKQANKK